MTIGSCPICSDYQAGQTHDSGGARDGLGESLQNSFQTASRMNSAETQYDIETMQDAATAIDALLIFAHQHSKTPMYREITTLARLRRRIEEKQNEKQTLKSA